MNYHNDKAPDNIVEPQQSNEEIKDTYDEWIERNSYAKIEVKPDEASGSHNWPVKDENGDIIGYIPLSGNFK